MRKLRTAAVFLCLMVAAALFRFPLLAVRPMHCDEAVNADKFGILLEQGRYEYSKQDFHGPTLYYLSLIPAKIQGIRSYIDLSEVTLRVVPAFLGVLLVGAHILLIPYFGLRAAAAAGLLTAVSPAMVYYSRYYIHEILLVLLSFCALLCLFGYCRRRRAVWAVSAGAFLGLMYATKETAILPVGCMLLAGMATLLFEKRRADPPPGRHLALAAAAALVVSGLLMSSFLSHPSGILDSLLAYRTYFARGAGINTFHVHPWNYYLSLQLYFHFPGKPVWSEALIAALALAGLWAAFSRAGVDGIHPVALRFIAFYTVSLLAVYSLIPYKVPWNELGFLHGEILLAGAGVAWLAGRCRTRGAAIVLAGLVGAGVAHLGWLAWQSSTRYAADPCNPWVYAHTGTDVFRIAARMESLAAVYPGGYALPVQVISRENLWPLPWYLRRFTGITWWNGVSATAPDAPVILATPDMEPAIESKLYEQPPPGRREMYMNLFERYAELRPRVEIRGYIAKPLWDDWRQRGDGR
ncbi:MAG: flippase activity-associated protein Agl23 [Bryobacteraceae bacterium]